MTQLHKLRTSGIHYFVADHRYKAAIFMTLRTALMSVRSLSPRPTSSVAQCVQGSVASPSHHAGFTLIELLITIVIATILMALAMPSFTSMLMNNRLSAEANAFVNALHYARSNALTQNVNAQVCPLGATGSVTCGANWGSGWIVTTLPATGTGVLLQSYQVGPHDPVLSPVAFNGVTATGIVFDPRGLATTQSNFKFCDSRGATFARSLQVIATGSVQQGPTPGLALWGGALACP